MKILRLPDPSASHKGVYPGHRAVLLPFPGSRPATLVQDPNMGAGQLMQDRRKSKLADIHIRLKRLYRCRPHFTEADYRDELDRRFGLSGRGEKVSAAGLTLDQLDELITWLSHVGGKGRPMVCQGRRQRGNPPSGSKETQGKGRALSLSESDHQ